MRKLSEILNKAKSKDILPFPFDNEEIIKNILQKTENIKNNINKSMNLRRKIIMTSSLITILAISFFLIYNLFVNQKTFDDSSTIDTSTTVKSDIIVEKENYYKIIEGINERKKYSEISLNEERDQKRIDIFGLINEMKRTEIPIIVLNPNELEKISIKKEGEDFQFIMEGFYDIEKNLVNHDNLTEMGYPIRGIYRSSVSTNNISKNELMKYDAWDMKTSAKIYPAYAYQRIFKGNSKIVNQKAPISPIISQKAYFYTDELRIISEKLIELDISHQKEYGLILFRGSELLDINSDDYPLSKYFVPLILRKGNLADGYITILWYVKTPQLVEKLPISYQKWIKKSNNITEYVTADGIDIPDYDKIHKKKEKPVLINQIGGIESLELSDEELEKIGIKKENGKYITCFEAKLKNKDFQIEGLKEILENLGYDTKREQLHLRSKKVIDTFDVNSVPLKYSGWSHTEHEKTFPVAISLVMNSWKRRNNVYNHQLAYLTIYSDYSPLLEHIENKWDILGMGDSNKVKPKIERILPVNFVLGDKTNNDTTKLRYSEVSIWFYVTKEFANLLPERYKEPILKELELISNIEDGLISIEEACYALKGEKSYFDICRLSGNNIKNLNIFPNPVTESKVRISFSLLKNSKISIDLYDVSGKFLFNISNQEFNQGIIEKDFDIPKISNGIYILSVNDDKGDMVINKIMIK